MNRTEHKMRMCFDPEYSRLYKSFLSGKKILIGTCIDDLKSEAGSVIFASLFVSLIFYFIFSFFIFFKMHVFFGVPLDLPNSLVIPPIIIFASSLVLFFFRSLNILINCIFGIRFQYKLFIRQSQHYLNKYK